MVFRQAGTRAGRRTRWWAAVLPGPGEFALSESTGRADGSFTQLAFTVDDLREEVADLIARGAVFLDFDAGGISTRHGIAEIAGSYPSRGTGELAAWLHDSEHNLIAVGSPIR